MIVLPMTHFKLVVSSNTWSIMLELYRDFWAMQIVVFSMRRYNCSVRELRTFLGHLSSTRSKLICDVLPVFSLNNDSEVISGVR